MKVYAKDGLLYQMTSIINPICPRCSGLIHYSCTVTSRFWRPVFLLDLSLNPFPTTAVRLLSDRSPNSLHLRKKNLWCLCCLFFSTCSISAGLWETLQCHIRHPVGNLFWNTHVLWSFGEQTTHTQTHQHISKFMTKQMNLTSAHGYEFSSSIWTALFISFLIIF